MIHIYQTLLLFLETDPQARRSKGTSRLAKKAMLELLNTEFGLWRNISLAALFMILTALVISAGVEQGIEKWSRRLMPSLLALLVSLIGYVLLQAGSIDGLRHYLVRHRR